MSIEIGDIYEKARSVDKQYAKVIRIDNNIIYYCSCDKLGVIGPNAGVFSCFENSFLYLYEKPLMEWVREESDYSYIDIIKQNMEISEKYNLDFAHKQGYLKEKVCEVIKKLEIDIFNLRESLKLSQELNEIYKKDIVDLKDKVCELNEEYD